MLPGIFDFKILTDPDCLISFYKAIWKNKITGKKEKKYKGTLSQSTISSYK